MADLAVLQQRLEELREVRASGVQRHRHGSKEVWWKPDQEIAAAIAFLEQEIAAAQGQQPVRVIHVRNSRGW